MWTTGRSCAPAVEILWLLCGLRSEEVESTGHGQPSCVVLVPHRNIRRWIRFRSATMMARRPTPVGATSTTDGLSYGVPYYCMEFPKSSSHAEQRNRRSSHRYRVQVVVIRSRVRPGTRCTAASRTQPGDCRGRSLRAPDAASALSGSGHGSGAPRPGRTARPFPAHPSPPPPPPSVATAPCPTRCAVRSW